VVAIAFALYAALRDVIGPAWAAAAVAGIVALLALIVALVAFRKAKPRASAKTETPGLASRLIDLAKERPMLAAGVATAAAAAAITVAIRNPRILTAIIAGLFAPTPPPRR
jgi:hypothetical protein